MHKLLSPFGIIWLALAGCAPPPAVEMPTEIVYVYPDSGSTGETDSATPPYVDSGSTGETDSATPPDTDTGSYVDQTVIDNDGDGYCEHEFACDDTSLPGDCDDLLANVHPGAPEVCDPDDVDEDCDSQPDDWDSNVTAKLLWMQDLDSDGFCNEFVDSRQCDKPASSFILADQNGDGDEYNDPRDCNDARVDVYPGAPLGECEAEPVDFDCDGSDLDCLPA